MEEKTVQCRKVKKTESILRYEDSGKEREADGRLRYRFVEDDTSIYEYDLACLDGEKKKP